ncbi:MAG: hypothetical protein Ctma_0694 [Catillopecten margaritatus gill symbiont]|uniref:Pentapeptide repeat-containing protein n=1 Tax=Catillopecten margaritatus gill symbiont TaxID=3083288 RepID=A0AAU6PG48_9GAMM
MMRSIHYFGKDYPIDSYGDSECITFNNTRFTIIENKEELLKRYDDDELEHLCINYPIDFNNNFLIDFNFKNCLFIRDIDIKEQSLSSYLFEGCQFEGTLRFIDCKFEASIFRGSVFKEIEIYFKENYDNEIFFVKCHFENKIKIRNFEWHEAIDGLLYEESQRNKAKLKTLELVGCTAGNEAYLRISYLKIDDFKIKNLRLPQHAELDIGDCHFKRMQLSNFRNVGQFKLYKINIFSNEKGSLFQIDNTSIGRTELQSVNLKSFDTVKMFDNIFTELNYTNIQWMNVIEVEQHNEKFDKESARKTSIHTLVYQAALDKAEKQRDAYRTLKNVALSNNDQVQASYFHAKEMENYQGSADSGDGDKEYRLSDKATLWLEKYTNRFDMKSGWSLILTLIFLYWALV